LPLLFPKSSGLYCVWGGMLPPCCWGLWQCCAILCCDCTPPPLTTLNEAGPQQDVDARQACTDSAEAMSSVDSPVWHLPHVFGGFGLSSVKELGGGWSQMLPLGYNVCSSACMGITEYPMVLLARDAV